MEKSYRFRIYPDEAQREQIEKTIGCCRYVYNHFLAERIEAYKNGGGQITRYEQSGRLTLLKKELEWLSEADARALQCALCDLERAYRNYYDGLKKGAKTGYPKYKSKREKRGSYRTVGGGKIEIYPNKIKLMKLGYVECVTTREVSGRILSATVTRTAAGGYYVSVCCEEGDEAAREKTGAAIGVEAGGRGEIYTSDGEIYGSSKKLEKTERQIRRAQRALTRKPRGGRNREKARLRYARLHERLANQRRDALQKMTTQLTRRNSVIAARSQGARELAAMRGEASRTGLMAWHEFMRQLGYKSRWRGRELLRAEMDDDEKSREGTKRTAGARRNDTR